MHEEEYEAVLRAIEQALAICECSATADDVVRMRLRRQLRELQLGLRCLLQPAESDAIVEDDEQGWSPPVSAM